LLSLIIPAYNAAELLPECWASIAAGRRVPDQVILVDDSSTDGTAAVAEQLGFTVLRTDRQSGPAVARNLGAEAALGDLLFFLDADCLLHADTLERAEAAFREDAELDALIGAYDLEPEAAGFVSRFRNLMHSYYHHRGRREASTFWGACGAVRRESFFAAGGFSPRFRRPSIEDIEFGRRLKKSGGRIVLDPAVQIRHRKKWTLGSMVRTDIRDRAIPWTRLILEQGEMPNDLNTSRVQRLAVALTLAGAGVVVLDWRLGLVCWGLAVVLNWRLYAFLGKHWSWWAAIAAAPLHLFYLSYSGLTFAVVTLLHHARLLR
jgi:glycosyltransferase involved in cell wall biosynthesis